MREFAMMKFRCLVVRMCGLLGIVEVSEPQCIPVYNDPRSPEIPAAVKANPFETSGVISPSRAVSVVLSFRAVAEIIFSIVEGVQVAMVIKSTRAANHLWHGLLSSNVATSPTEGVKAPRAGIPDGRPRRCHKALEIFYINNRILALRERNQAVWLIERLNYFMAFHPAFHGSSPGRFDVNFTTGGALSAG